MLPQPIPKSPRFGSTIGFYSLGNGVKSRLIGPLVRHKFLSCTRRSSTGDSASSRDWDRAEFVDVPFVDKPSRIS